MKEVRVKANSQNIDEVFNFIEGELEAIEGVSRQEVLKLHMVVDEIYTNIVKYAYGPRDQGYFQDDGFSCDSYD